MPDIKELEKKIEELGNAFQDPSICSNPQKIQRLSQEYNKAKEELKKLKGREDKNVIIEIRAGVGGDEAELFAAELFRMYNRYSQNKNWKIRIMNSNKTPLEGFKEITFEISGSKVYDNLKYESGVHRVQRIPATEKNGRIHTSTVSVAVLPEASSVDIQIDPKDLRVDTFCASGHGGQSVNTTYSAVRITHLPTNLVVGCQDERSQRQNKDKAMIVLMTKLLSLEEEKKQKEEAQKRKEQIGTAMRAEKTRTYNFPQDRITDHRIQQSWHGIEQIMEGNLDPIIEKLKNTN
ncbi:MAG: peptide chain release factor 1 [Parcubacteria group bacterium Athens0714_12]|nr:MAG: peptide chain release factor 1 [Parcubacteria group bacterium Athens0714_12]